MANEVFEMPLKNRKVFLPRHNGLIIVPQGNLVSWGNENHKGICSVSIKYF
ncbi:hypothetical protein JBW_00192 [Pelosinus fermentans JBW45]|uniref:Uncharacterized protein n=1 Tax=Pelosinus fermentans JBW45 TaxID=1192197 RepID=I9NJR8_9FIRM|nr:hypothetical protein JBW_00192 [Pelosinus fermentans JBW45]